MKKFYYLSPLILQTIIWIPTRIVLWFFVKFEVKGLHNLEEAHCGKGIIFASNHSSELDPIILPAGLPFLSCFMPIFYSSREKKHYTESGFRQIFYGGTLFKLWGAHPIYSGLKDYEKSLVNHVQLLKDKKSLMIFPEGGISDNGTLGPARGGVGYLASETNCPIIPIGISGAYHMSVADFFLRRRKITLSFGKPMFVQQISHAETENTNHHPVETYKEIAESVMQTVQTLK